VKFEERIIDRTDVSSRYHSSNDVVEHPAKSDTVDITRVNVKADDAAVARLGFDTGSVMTY
jgi:hypothetical protein